MTPAFVPISFPTEWLIPSDSTAFLAEKEKITDIQMIVKISQIIPVFFLFILFSVIFFPVFLILYYASDI